MVTLAQRLNVDPALSCYGFGSAGGTTQEAIDVRPGSCIDAEARRLAARTWMALLNRPVTF